MPAGNTKNTSAEAEPKLATPSQVNSTYRETSKGREEKNAVGFCGAVTGKYSWRPHPIAVGFPQSAWFIRGMNGAMS